MRVPWTLKEIQAVHSKGDQPWDFFGRNDAKAETPVLCLLHAKIFPKRREGNVTKKKKKKKTSNNKRGREPRRKT